MAKRELRQKRNKKWWQGTSAHSCGNSYCADINWVLCIAKFSAGTSWRRQATRAGSWTSSGRQPIWSSAGSTLTTAECQRRLKLNLTIDYGKTPTTRARTCKGRTDREVNCLQKGSRSSRGQRNRKKAKCRGGNRCYTLKSKVSESLELLMNLRKEDIVGEIIAASVLYFQIYLILYSSIIRHII